MRHLIIIGAQKAGTTSLFDYLNHHPQIVTAEVKEINFFTFQFDKGLGWYEGLFDATQSVALDASPQYLHHAPAAERLGQMLPKALLVCLVRDPIARAVSNYQFNIARGLQDPSETFAKCVRSARGREIYLDKGLYATQLDRYASFQKAGQLMLVDFDKLKRAPDKVVAEVCRFAGIAPELIEKSTHKISNKTEVVGGVPARIIYIAMSVKNRNSVIFNQLPSWVQSGLRGLKMAVTKASISPSSNKQVLDNETNEYLVEFFANDVQRMCRDYGVSPTWATRYAT